MTEPGLHRDVQRPGRGRGRAIAAGWRVFREVESMARVREPRQFVYAAIDGIGWLSRQANLRRIRSLWAQRSSNGTVFTGRFIKPRPAEVEQVSPLELRVPARQGLTRPDEPGTTTTAPARPSPLPAGTGTGTAIEVERVVNAVGLVGLAGAQVNAGFELAGQRVTLRMDGTQMAVISHDGALLRTLPCPVAPRERHHLRGHGGPPTFRLHSPLR